MTKLKINDQQKSFKYNDIEIHVKKYLPISEKLDIIDIALQNSIETTDGWYNELKLEMYFNLYLVYSYTDLEFTEEEKMNPEELYDKLESNNIFKFLIATMDEQEYMFLYNYLGAVKNDRVSHSNSAAGVIKTIIQDLPKNASAANQILEHFDPEKFKQVKEFAEDYNGKVLILSKLKNLCCILERILINLYLQRNLQSGVA